MPKRLLTDKFCQHAKTIDDAAQTDYFDEQTTGLALRVSRSGRKTWNLVYGPAAKRVRITLGTYPATSLGAARSAADIALGKIEAGNDPRLSASDTLRAICEEYLKREGAKLRTKDWREAALKRLVYPELGAAPVGEIKRSDIVRLLDRIEDERGPVMADRTLAIIRRVMNWHALRSDDFRSPIARGMARTNGKDLARDRVLTDDELRAIWRAAGGTFGRFVKFVLLTATRRTEAARIHRDEIEGLDWTIPAARYKTKVDHLVPLSAQAVALVGNSAGFAFSTDGRTPLRGFGKAKAHLQRESKTKGWTIHDLRRTARTLMSRAGVNPDHAERCLGHLMPGVRGTYDRFAYRDEKRAAFKALAALVADITTAP